MRQFFGLIFLAAVSFADLTGAQIPESSPWDRATLYRDEWGVPHIYAQDSHALAFAFGYAQSEDHLESMLLAFRMANGRAAEVLGEGYVDSDELALRMRHGEMAYNAYLAADDTTHALCSGFAEGILEWMTNNRDRVPEWAEGIRPSDVLALLHFFMLSQTPFDLPGAYYPAKGMPSGNAWAVGPALSKSGKPILVMSPHANYTGPFQWYEAHLAGPGYEVYGATLFGLPIMLMGHNPFLAWALTPNEPDNGDVYIEYDYPVERNPNSVMANRAKSDPSPMTSSQRKSYYVWDGGQLEQRSARTERTPRGPVVAYKQGTPFSLRAGGYGQFGALQQLYDMGRASNLAGFRRALAQHRLPTFHVLYADRGGSLFYRYGAVVGEKQNIIMTASDGSSGSFSQRQRSFWDAPLANANFAFMWGRPLDYAATPEIVNPASGFLQASGSPPWLVTPGVAGTRGQWPSWLVRDEDTYRAKRLRRLLVQGQRGLNDHQAILFDRVVPFAVVAVPFLLDSANALKIRLDRAHPDLPAFLGTLQDWDYLADSDSYAMTCFHVWWQLFRVDGNGDVLPNETIHALVQQQPEWFRRHAIDSASQAAMLMRNAFQSISIPWGEVHGVQRGDRWMPMEGATSGDPLLMSGDTIYNGSGWPVTKGIGFAMAVELDDTPQARSLVPFGSSEQKASPHYDDQLDLMAERRMKRTHFLRQDVERYARQAIGTYAALRVPQNDARVWVRSTKPLTLKLRTATTGLELPRGLAAFSRYVETEVVPVNASFGVDLEFSVSPEVCGDSHLAQLSVYGYDPRFGWKLINEQQRADGRRVLQARAYQGGVFAVLGPEEWRQASVETASPLPVDQSVIPPKFQEEEEPAWRLARDRADGLNALRDEDADRISSESTLDFSSEDVRRVASAPRPTEQGSGLQGPRFNVPAEVDDGQAWARMRSGVVIPNVPPGWSPEALRQSQQASVAGLAPPPPPARRPNATAIRRPSRGASNSGGAAAPNGEPSAPEIPARAVPEEPRLDALEPSTEAESYLDNEEAKEERLEEIRDTAHALKADETAVLFSDVTPRDMKKSEPKVNPDDFNLAEDPTLASPTLTGRQLELRPPYRGMVFKAMMKSPVMAQAILVEIPPSPLPEGLTLYAPIVNLLYTPPNVNGTTVMTIHIDREAVAPEHFNELKIYTYDRLSGWLPMKGHKKNATIYQLSGMDMKVRTYAVMGPKEHRLKAIRF